MGVDTIFDEAETTRRGYTMTDRVRFRLGLGSGPVL